MENKFHNNRAYLDRIFTYQESLAPWKAGKILQIIKKNNLQPKSVCEYFCGLGEILNVLSKHESGSPAHYFGFDINEMAIERCRKKSGPNLTFEIGDMIDDGKKFDIALAIDIIEHVKDYYGFLETLKSKAEYKMFHIPLEMCVQNVIRSKPLIHEREKVGHTHYFSKETALATLKDAGYEIIDYSYTKACFELPLTAKGKLLKIPRKILFAINEDLASSIFGGFSLIVLAK